MTTTTAEHDRNEMKDCSMCGESILAVAKKCKHCGSALSEATMDSSEEEKTSEKRKVGFLLGMGIFFLAPIFSWYTLRKGYSNFARSVSFIWMVISFAASLQDNKLVDTEQVGSVSSVQGVEQSDLGLKPVERMSDLHHQLSDEINETTCGQEYRAMNAQNLIFKASVGRASEYARQATTRWSSSMKMEINEADTHNMEVLNDAMRRADEKYLELGQEFSNCYDHRLAVLGYRMAE